MDPYQSTFPSGSGNQYTPYEYQTEETQGHGYPPVQVNQNVGEANATYGTNPQTQSTQAQGYAFPEHGQMQTTPGTSSSYWAYNQGQPSQGSLHDSNAPSQPQIPYGGYISAQADPGPSYYISPQHYGSAGGTNSIGPSTTQMYGGNQGFPGPSIDPARSSPSANVPQRGGESTRRRPMGRSRDQPLRRSPLDPDYVVRRNPQQFFTVGKVFLIYWCAPAGNNKGSAWTEETEGITLENRHREAIYSSHRRFIVVSSDRQKCLCVPILTYGRRATTKRGINVQAHAVAHLSNAPAPALLRGEEVLSKGCIVIVPKDSLVRLHKTSRIDFSTVCTIEHNQKVKEVGGVADHSMEKLINLFNEQNLSSRE